MRFKSFSLFVLFVSSLSFANLNDGLQKGQKILFVRLATQVQATGPTDMSWVANKFKVHHTVVQSTSIPNDLSTYDQVWDIRWPNANNRTLSDADITKLQNFMKNDSGSVFLLGENAGYSNTWTPLRTFVNSITKEGGFAASGVGFGNAGYNLSINAAACGRAENFDTDFLTGWTKVWTEYPGMVKLTELAGGEAVIRGTGLGKDDRGISIAGWGGVNQTAAGAVAFTSDKMKDAYSGGKLFVFFDSQAFHCWGSTAWGMNDKHKNNLKFFWNALDFLTKTTEPAKLTATPSSSDTLPYEYAGQSLNVTLATDLENRIAWQIVTGTDTTALKTTGVGVYSTSVEISGDATILATTVLGGNYSATSKSWNYIVERTTPSITTLTADSLTYYSVRTGGDITSNGGESIIEKGVVLSLTTNPDTSDNRIIATSNDSLFTTLLDTLQPGLRYYVRAYAINNQGISYGNQVVFTTPVLPKAQLTASPGDTTYTTANLSVTLYTDSGNTIFYTTTGAVPDTTDSSQVLNGGDSTGSIIITGDVTLKAIAIGNNFVPTNMTWSYVCDLASADLSGQAILTNRSELLHSTTDTVHFGHAFTLVLMSSGINKADSISWIYGTNTEDSLLWEKYQNPIVINPTTTLPVPQGDTLVITARAYDDDHTTTTKSYIFVRDTVATLSMTPSTKFANSQMVSISLSPFWENQKIYYTTDSTTPDSTSTPYTSAFTATSTTTVQAIAYADNAVKSEVISETYTHAIGVLNAWYIDSDGNGSIDKARVKLSNTPDQLPDSISLINPFDTTDMLLVSRKDMILQGDEIGISLNKVFYDSAAHSTAFVEGPHGSIYGDSYHEVPFILRDAVAPLVLKAIYQPGSIQKKSGAIVREEDTLFVTFTEALRQEDLSTNGRFFTLQSDDVGTPYSFELTLSNYQDQKATFIVNAISGIDYPHENDEIRIALEDSLGDVMNGNMQLVADNKSALLEVRAIEVQPEIYALGPVNPQTFEIPADFQSSIKSGVAFVVDYLIVLPQSVQEELDLQITILDPVGNNVASISGIDQKSNASSVTIKDSQSTQLLIAWNGKNRNSRYASTGAYLAMVQYKSSDGTIWKTKKVMIGIRE